MHEQDSTPHAKKVNSNAKQGCMSSANSQSPVAGRTKAHTKKGSQASAIENATNAKENTEQIEIDDFMPERISFVVRKKKPVSVQVSRGIFFLFIYLPKKNLNSNTFLQFLVITYKCINISHVNIFFIQYKTKESSCYY